MENSIGSLGEANKPAGDEMIPVLSFSTDAISPGERYEAWLRRDWPRSKLIYRTEPKEPFNTRWESAQLGPVSFVYTEITAMAWERRIDEIRTSDFDPIVVNMMVEGRAQGELGGRPFLEGPGELHFHDLGQRSLHVSTASRTYSVVVPRPIAEIWFGPVHELHGRVADGAAAALLHAHARQTHASIREIAVDMAEPLGRSFLELIKLAAEAVRPLADRQVSREVALRRRAEEEIDRRLGEADISVGQIAAALDVSRARLFAAFQCEGGVHAFVQQQRLERARLALADLQRLEPIGHIAHRLGFSDASHLGRLFRRRFGMTPREYRSMIVTDAESEQA